MSIIPFNPTLTSEWDSFVTSSCNGTFLFRRAFMDYHSQRFTDSSLLFYSDKDLCALLPANISGDTVFSHVGLTYGGFIVAASTTVAQQLDIFDKAIEYFRNKGVNRIIIKPVPHIYNQQPAEVLNYALFKVNAQRMACGLSMAVNLRNPLPMQTLRRRCMNKALRAELAIVEGNEHIPQFHALLSHVLQTTHNVTPVHTVDEMKLLAQRFPAETRLLTVWRNDRMLAGTWLFITPRVVHAQYISANDEGKSLGALDLLFTQLIKNPIGTQDYLDFGICTEQNGEILNHGLTFQKEGFGARAIVYDQYMINL